MDLVEGSSNKNFLQSVFRPSHLGEFSKGGMYININRSENPNEQHRDFSLKYMMNEGKGGHLKKTDQKDMWFNKKNENNQPNNISKQ